MRPRLEIIPVDLSSSIAVKRVFAPHIDYPHWHYHPENEIIYIKKSSGIRLIGDHVGSFQKGDLIFIGSNLPHLWKNNKSYYDESKNLLVDMYVVHFREHTFGKNFFDRPELSHIKKLFSMGKQGFFVRGKDVQKISKLIKALYRSSGFDRMILFLKTLDALASSRNYTLLSNNNSYHFISNNSKKINQIMDFIVSNYTRQIKLEEVANLANLNKPSFCRFFKSITHKTYTQFLNEMRIAKACDLLLNTDMTVTSICYETGFNNISHFNRQFKNITGNTAREYRKK